MGRAAIGISGCAGLVGVYGAYELIATTHHRAGWFWLFLGMTVLFLAQIVAVQRALADRDEARRSAERAESRAVAPSQRAFNVEAGGDVHTNIGTMATSFGPGAMHFSADRIVQGTGQMPPREQVREKVVALADTFRGHLQSGQQVQPQNQRELEEALDGVVRERFRWPVHEVTCLLRLMGFPDHQVDHLEQNCGRQSGLGSAIGALDQIAALLESGSEDAQGEQ